MQEEQRTSCRARSSNHQTALVIPFYERFVLAWAGDGGRRFSNAECGMWNVVANHDIVTPVVGSVCTLLGEKLLAKAQCLLEPRYMKTLLLAGVLLDTENHDFVSKRDTEMTTIMLVGSGSLGRNGFFNQLKGVS